MTLMTQKTPVRIILVVEDIAETREGIEHLLKSDGYRVIAARDEEDAVSLARHTAPDLILVSPGGPHPSVIAAAQRIRRYALCGAKTDMQLRSRRPDILTCREHCILSSAPSSHRPWCRRRPICLIAGMPFLMQCPRPATLHG